MSAQLERGTRELRWTLTALLLVFITLKLAGVGEVAGWPWWAVLLPLLAPASVAVAITTAYLVVLVVTERRYRRLRERRAREAAEAKYERERAPQAPAKTATNTLLSAGGMIERQYRQALGQLGATAYYEPEHLRTVIHHPELGEPLVVSDAELDHETPSADPGARPAYIIDRLAKVLELTRQRTT